MACPPHILVVEDDASIRVLAERVLESCDHWTVDSVADGDGALRAWADGDYDVILMDMRLPGVGGCEITEKIREAELHTGKHVSIVAYTALPEEGFECRLEAFDAIVFKPATPQDLIEVIEGLLHH